MQRRIQDWGWEAVVFREGGGKLCTGRVSPSTSDLPLALQSFNQSHLLNNGGHLFLPFVTSLRGKLNTLTVILHSRTPYSNQINKLSKPMVPVRQIGPPTR